MEGTLASDMLSPSGSFRAALFNFGQENSKLNWLLEGAGVSNQSDNCDVCFRVVSYVTRGSFELSGAPAPLASPQGAGNQTNERGSAAGDSGRRVHLVIGPSAASRRRVRLVLGLEKYPLTLLCLTVRANRIRVGRGVCIATAFESEGE
jgi:hypothetical protein